MPPHITTLTMQLLTWVAGGERTYREAMDIWREHSAGE